MVFHPHVEPLDIHPPAHTSLDSDSFSDPRLLTGKLAHELINPLDAALRYVNMTIQLLEDQAFDQSRDYLLRGREGLLHMSNLISTWLLNVEQVQAVPKRLTLSQIVDQAIDMSLTQHDRATIQIERQIPETLPKLKPRILLQICVNMITNANDALAMKRDKTLEISAQHEDDMLHMTFADSGCGLSKTKTDQIFAPFYSTKPLGTGLGLTICKEMILKHHGRMDAQNRPGGGAVFTVHLPLERLT